MEYSKHLVDDYLKYTVEALSSLDDLLEELKAEARENDTLSQEIFAIAHNIKGMGSSFGYDLMTSAGHSLCFYFRSLPTNKPSKPEIVEAHVQILHTIMDNKIVGDGGESGRRLIERLEELVSKEIN